MKRLKLFIPFILFVVVVPFFMNALTKDPNDLPSVLISRTVPEFQLPDLDNTSVILTEKVLNIGQPYLLNIWATWCASCKHEHPFLVKLAESGIPVYGINWKDDDGLARKELLRTGNPYTRNIFDKEGSLVMALGVTAAPETFVVDADGIIRYKRTGMINDTVWTQEMAQYFYGDK